MQLQIIHKTDWVLCGGDEDDARYVEAELYSAALHGAEIERTSGYGVRLSMSGYMDCTEWAVFGTLDEAKSHAAFEWPDEWAAYATLEDRVAYECGDGAWYSGDMNAVDYGGIIFIPGDDRKVDDERGEDIWHGWYYVTAVRIEPLGNACGELGVLIERLTIPLPEVERGDGWAELGNVLSALSCAGPDLDYFCSDDVTERDRWMMLCGAIMGYGGYELDADPYSGAGRALLISEEEAYDDGEDPIKKGDDYGFGPVTAVIPSDHLEAEVEEYALTFAGAYGTDRWV